ncbi:hypothetical protein TNCV_2174511 [Trichonephila clavipes]|nr:hypothetical protein TNCV_2174511 [Trichonephila clavipes]
MTDKYAMRIATQTSESALICKSTRPHSLSLQFRCSRHHYAFSDDTVQGVVQTDHHHSLLATFEIVSKVMKRCCEQELCSHMQLRPSSNFPMIRPRKKARCRLTD